MTRQSIAQSRASARQWKVDARKTLLEARMLRQRIRVLDMNSKHRREGARRAANMMTASETEEEEERDDRDLQDSFQDLSFDGFDS